MTDGGWYIDESDATLVRWHDGVDWTDYALVRTDWEGLDGPPPPPEAFDWGPEPARRRPWGLAGAAVAAVLLVVAAASQMDDGGSGNPAGSNSEQERSADDDDAVANDLADVPDLDDVTTTDDTGDDGDTDVARNAGSTGGSGSRSGGPPTSSAVRRTETIIQTQSNPSPQTSVGSGDQSDVGNTSRTTIATDFNPPPDQLTTTTAAPTTTADTTPTTETTSGE